MALRMLKSAGGKQDGVWGIKRWIHGAAALPAPLQNIINPPINNNISPFILPEEEDQIIINDDKSHLFGGGSMELMAVPKRKTTPHKRGIRNGPKALKPVPVIIRCRVCGRVKLPHFFCCGGIKPNPS